MEYLFIDDVLVNIKYLNAMPLRTKVSIGLILRLMSWDSYVGENRTEYMPWGIMAIGTSFKNDPKVYHYTGTSMSLLFYILLNHIYPESEWKVYLAYLNSHNVYLPYFRSYNKIAMIWNRYEMNHYRVSLTDKMLGSNGNNPFEEFLSMYDPRFLNNEVPYPIGSDHLIEILKLYGYEEDPYELAMTLTQPNTLFRKDELPCEEDLSYMILKSKALDTIKKICANMQYQF